MSPLSPQHRNSIVAHFMHEQLAKAMRLSFILWKLCCSITHCKQDQTNVVPIHGVYAWIGNKLQLDDVIKLSKTSYIRMNIPKLCGRCFVWLKSASAESPRSVCRRCFITRPSILLKFSHKLPEVYLYRFAAALGNDLCILCWVDGGGKPERRNGCRTLVYWWSCAW